MLVWKGWGFLVFLIPLFCSLLIQFILDSNFGDGFYKSTSWTMPLVFIFSAVPTCILGYKLNNKAGRIVVDIETNERIELKEKHSFFWIPMQYWAVIIIGISAWMYLANIGFIY